MIQAAEFVFKVYVLRADFGAVILCTFNIDTLRIDTHLVETRRGVRF